MESLEEKLERQKIIFERQLEQEQKAIREILFLDRGLPDAIAYSKYLIGFIPKELNYNLSDKYDIVFILERLPFKDDGLRIENGGIDAEFIHNKIIQTYKDYGYFPVFVPVMSVQERVDFILNNSNRLKGGNK